MVLRRLQTTAQIIEKTQNTLSRSKRLTFKIMIKMLFSILCTWIRWPGTGAPNCSTILNKKTTLGNPEAHS
jgi:hypothetical protein